MSFTLLTRCDTFSSSVTCLQGGLVIVSARYGILEDILTHERSHASSSEEASTTPESTHRPEETQPHSRGAAGLPLALRICYCCRLTHGFVDGMCTGQAPVAQSAHRRQLLQQHGSGTFFRLHQSSLLCGLH